MSAAALIKKFGQTITVLRDTNAESTVKGRPVADVRTTITMTASVQPLEPDEVAEEDIASERNRMGIKIYSSQELKTVDNRTRLKADIVVYDGEQYEVLKVDKYVGNKRMLQHYRAMAWLVNQKAPA